jgi:hypothetical protein
VRVTRKGRVVRECREAHDAPQVSPDSAVMVRVSFILRALMTAVGLVLISLPGPGFLVLVPGVVVLAGGLATRIATHHSPG